MRALRVRWKSHPKPSRCDSPVPQVHSLNRFVFSVPCLEDAERFYGAFGLRVMRSGDALHLHTFGQTHCWAHIFQTPGTTKRLEYLSFGCFPDDEAAFAERVRAAHLHKPSARTGWRRITVAFGYCTRTGSLSK